MTATIGAIALVVSYFSGPILNFGDFSRYGKTFGEVKKGNYWGLPVNFLFFSLLVVCTVSAGVTVIGKDENGAIITDPVHRRPHRQHHRRGPGRAHLRDRHHRYQHRRQLRLPAFDFSNVAPTKITWRTGGMIAAVGSVLITPWNLFNNPDAIHYAGHPRRGHRPAVRHPPGRLLSDQEAEDRRRRPVQHGTGRHVRIPQGLESGRGDRDRRGSDTAAVRGHLGYRLRRELHLVHRRRCRRGRLLTGMKYAPKTIPLRLGVEPVVGADAADGSAERTLY